MKIKRNIIIWLLIIGGLFINNLSFAQETNDCNVCMTSAEEFDMLLNMTNELVNYIKTTGKEWEYIWDYINPNRYEWTKFNPPSTKKRLTNLVLQAESVITTTALIISPRKVAWLDNYFYWFMLMFKNKVFPRDYKKILDMESRISDKIFELWLWGWYLEKINEKNTNDIKKILEKYKEKWLLSNYYISKDITYRNVVDQANSITSKLKNFLATNSTKQFLKLNGNLTLNINTEKLKNLDSAYQCSNQCNETLTTLWNSVNDINETMKSWVKNSSQAISKSIKKFKEEIWWIKKSNMFKEIIQTNWLTGTEENIQWIWEADKMNKKDTKTSQSIKDKKTEIQSQTTTWRDTKSLIRNSILWIIASNQEDIEYAIISETKNSNRYFEELSKTINKNIEIIKSFKKNLNDSANLQCSQ